MPLNTQNSRITFKYSTISGETPSIAPSLDHTDGTWDPTSLYVGEFFLNAADDNMWIRTLNGIVPITSGSSSHLISTYVNKTGDTMTGDLYGTGFYGTNISGDTIYGITFSGGTYYGDGSNLTGITVSWNGGTVSGDTTFNSIVDFCGGGIKIDNIEVCSGSTLQIIGDTEMIGTLTTTNDLTVGGVIYGDGSGITGIPALSAITLDEVLIQGDTSVNGDINLINGNITLTNGIFYGDGSGLTNISSSASTPSLSEVLLNGNTTGDNWIDVSESGTGYGLYSGTYGSDYNLINFRNDRLLLYSWNGVDPKSQVTLWRDGNVDIQGNNTLGLSGDNGVILQSNAGNIDFDVFSAITVNSPSSTFRGIEYDDDYSSNYTNRSLVDKEYVDNQITASTPSLSEVLLNGNTTSGSNIILGTDKITSGFGDPHSIYFSEGTININNDYSANREGRLTLNNGPSLSYLYNRQYVGANYTEGKLAFNNSTTKLNVFDDNTSAEAFIAQDLSGGYPTQVLLTQDLSGRTSQIFLDSTGYLNLYVDDLSNEVDLSITPTDGITVTTTNGKGIQYDADYSSTYTNRSLVDKEYVDGVTSGNTNGSGSANQITYWSDSNTITGSSKFTYLPGLTDVFTDLNVDSNNYQQSYIAAGTNQFIMNGEGNTNRIRLQSYNNQPTASANFDFLKLRGTNSSPARIENGDEIGEISFIGSYTGSSVTTGLEMTVIASENWDTNNTGTEFKITKHNNGDSYTSLLSTVFHIDGDGNTSFNNNRVSTSKQFKAGDNPTGVISSNSFNYDCDAGMTQLLDMNAATSASTITFSNQLLGNTYTLIVRQRAGGYNLVFPTGWWLNDTAFDFTTLATDERAIVTMTYLDYEWYFAVKKLTQI